MIEIRPIRAGETITFLQLLCDVFEVDFARARSIFFSEPYYDLNRKWALFDGGVMRSILTTTPLQFGWGPAFGVAGVATRLEDQGRGFAGELLQAVLHVSQNRGEGPALLFARDPRLYARLGFEVRDETVRVPLGGSEADAPTMNNEQVRARYQRWALEHPDRLVRDEQRWKFWRWNLRTSIVSGGGYLCFESDTVREVVDAASPPDWPVGVGSVFWGLRSMAEQVGLDPRGIDGEAKLMILGSSRHPQFFLTDQF